MLKCTFYSVKLHSQNKIASLKTLTFEVLAFLGGGGFNLTGKRSDFCRNSITISVNLICVEKDVLNHFSQNRSKIGPDESAQALNK